MSGALFPEATRRALFPWVEGAIHLGAAAETPLPAPSHAAMLAFYEDYRVRGFTGFHPWLAELDRCRAALATLVGAADPDDVALVANTTAGARIVAHALPLAAGDRILTNALEFPSNLWPWEDAAARVGARVERLPGDGLRTPPEGLRDGLEPADAGPVRAVAWSWVQYRDGFRSDLCALGALAREAGAWLAVDGIQGVGVVPLDLRRTPVDALYCGGHKWLMGLGGGGFLVIPKGRIPELAAYGRGWLSVEDPLAMDPDAPPRGTARRFEEGNLPLGHYFALRRSVELLLEVGVEAVFAHVLGLQDHLMERLEGSGFRPASSLQPQERGPILALDCPEERPAAQVVAALADRDIHVTARAGRLRLAPHLYNTRGEMDTLAATLVGLG